MKISKINQRYEHGKDDIFAEVVILKYLLDNEDYKDFHHELSRCFKKYKPNDEVISQMGFPSNWKNMIRYKVLV